MSPDPFEALDPPVGGLTRLRSRLDAEEGRRRRFALLALPLAAAAALLFALLRPAPTLLSPLDEGVGFLAAGVGTPPELGLQVRNGVVVEVETGDPDLLFVLVGRRLPARGFGARSEATAHAP